jgi:hypothetical protein
MFFGCTNPFAPKLDPNPDDNSSLISDQKNIEGIFQNLKYAYTFKDTLVYGGLLTSDFTFTYHDYDQGFDKTWGRDEEMVSAYGLFTNTQMLDLTWNNIILSTQQDSLTANIIRSFNLRITFNPTDVVTVDGRVNLTMRKNIVTEKWMINRWIDESNF